MREFTDRIRALLDEVDAISEEEIVRVGKSTVDPEGGDFRPIGVMYPLQQAFQAVQTRKDAALNEAYAHQNALLGVQPNDTDKLEIVDEVIASLHVETILLTYLIEALSFLRFPNAYDEETEKMSVTVGANYVLFTEMPDLPLVDYTSLHMWDDEDPSEDAEIEDEGSIPTLQ